MEHIIKPRIAPRDVTDVLIGIPVGLFQVVILFCIPAIVAGLLSRSILIGFIAYFAVYFVALLFMVRKVTISENGITFHRVLGTPSALSWSQIDSIVEVNRKELIIKGWLWPLFPSREITPSLSAKRHFRISWQGGFCYFPPKDIALFEKLSDQYINNDLNKSIQATPDGAPD